MKTLLSIAGLYILGVGVALGTIAAMDYTEKLVRKYFNKGTV
jgi:hypothetical protein